MVTVARSVNYKADWHRDKTPQWIMKLKLIYDKKMILIRNIAVNIHLSSFILNKTRRENVDHSQTLSA